jgi:hypothetical protein
MLLPALVKNMAEFFETLVEILHFFHAPLKVTKICLLVFDEQTGRDYGGRVVRVES